MKLPIILTLAFLLVKIQPGFGALERIQCRYYEWGTEGYSCELLITNPNAWDNFTTIEGTHMDSRQNSDVRTIRRNAASYTTNIPSVICNTFRNVVFFYYGGCHIRDIGANSFSGCLNLTNIFLDNNRIERISPHAFHNNALLSWIHINRNFITDLPRNLFLTTELQLLSIENNFLQVIHADTFIQQRRFGFLMINNNLVRAFDERLIGSSNLFDVRMTGNVCVDTNVNDGSPNRDVLRSTLQTCFSNYRDRLD